jgi:hypothetical protein
MEIKATIGEGEDEKVNWKGMFLQEKTVGEP